MVLICFRVFIFDERLTSCSARFLKFEILILFVSLVVNKGSLTMKTTTMTAADDFFIRE